VSAQKIPVQPWMTAAPVARVLAALGAPIGGAQEVDVRFVGGAVRNAVMNLAVEEVDLATPETPPRVTERLEKSGIKAVPTGIDHGTVMAVAGEETFEITTLRRDTACDGRHADVAFTTDWSEDARRRDFTINAMSLRLDPDLQGGTLFDDHGGVNDARAGVVRFVGDPADRIREDYLRILRLFRFYARYGRAPIDPDTLAAVRAHVSGLARLSAERVQQELAKLLAAPAPLAAVILMAQTGVLEAVLPEAHNTGVLEKVLRLEGDVGGDWLRRLAALLPAQAQAAQSAADRLKLSNADRDRLVALLRDAPALDDSAAPLDLRRALYHYGAPLVGDRLLLAWARQEGEANTAPWRALLEATAQWTPRLLPISGEDILALGLKPGPAVGLLLRAAEEWWIGAGFAPGRNEVLAHVAHLATERDP
jgi:poly(A) polymerase